MQGSEVEQLPKKQKSVRKKMKFYINYTASNNKPSPKEKRKLICKKYREKKKTYIINLTNEILNLQTQIEHIQRQSRHTMLDVLNNIIILKAQHASININKDLLLTSTTTSSYNVDNVNDTMKEDTLLEQTQIFSLYNTISTLQKEYKLIIVFYIFNIMYFIGQLKGCYHLIEGLERKERVSREK